MKEIAESGFQADTKALSHMVDHAHPGIPRIIDSPYIGQVAYFSGPRFGIHGDRVVHQKVGTHPPDQLQFKNPVYNAVSQIEGEFQVIQVLSDSVFRIPGIQPWYVVI